MQQMPYSQESQTRLFSIRMEAKSQFIQTRNFNEYHQMETHPSIKM